ncbi:MAG TPA: tail fiber domain-containing protein, partial [Terracidiphilus sp.]
GSFNTALGLRAGGNLTTGDNNIDIGNAGIAGESNTIRIGGNVGVGTQSATFIAAVHGVTTGNNNAIPVVIDSAGQLGTVSSSLRYKTEVKPMNKASESVLALKPVSFRYKVHNDTKPQFGLIAEEVAKVNPDLVIYDGDGNPYTVRYDAVNAMLLNEFLKEHRKVEQLTKDFQSKLTEQQQQIEALTTGLQQVRTQIEVSKSAPRTVLNDQ